MKLSTRIQATIVTGVLVLMGGTALGMQAITTGAEEPNPIIEQVGQHEERIDTLEGRADETDAAVEQNSADVQVIQQETGVSPAPRSQSGQVAQPAQSAPTAQPSTPTPVAEPAKNPRYIVAVADSPATSGMHSCHYTLFDPAQNVTAFIQPVEIACYAVGDELPYV